jgi:predicted DNA-binding protein
LSADRARASRPRVKRTQIHPRLPEDLGKRLRAFTTGKGASQGSVIQAALIKYLDDANDGTLIMRRLDRISRGVGRLHRDVRVVAEAFAVFVQLWLAHTPRISDSEKSRAERVALARFGQFTEHVAARIASGRSVISDLVRDDAGDDADIAGTAPAPSEGEHS